MPRKSAKEIVEDVVAKVNQEIPTRKKAAPKKEEPQKAVEHNRLCMVIVANGACNCPVSKL